MAVLHFFLVNSSLYILFSMIKVLQKGIKGILFKTELSTPKNYNFYNPYFFAA